MAEKKKGKKRKEEYVAPGEEVADKPAKEEFVIAKWMRKNVQIKKTKFLNHNVEYFTAKRAVDALLESKWAQGDEPLFKTREDIVDYLHLMLEHKFYHRARKVPVSEQELKGKKKEKKNESEEKEKSKEKEKVTDAESSVVEGKEQQPEKEKRKKKVRLEMHNDQRFVDGMDAYVWIYDPIPFHYWIFGTLLVLGAIGVCLFPLWPPSVRLGVYYLSVAAAGFLVTIIVLAVIRLIIFCLIWTFTMGKHHLWILPNLTEDVGFFASFWPLYTYEYKGGETKKDKKKKKKDKDSDGEQEEEKSKEVKKDEEKISEIGNEGGSQVETLGASETESESSQRSSTGKDFEIVDQDELES
ncbi:translocation protein SEC62 [Tribolium madens]|uniref:translocation protein SEC62 n=1 Tax=Tribolium madens TaxID=41895 RepID=UPI001CF74D41|nr:translocation protein SEC62 [Tribolium madens]